MPFTKAEIEALPPRHVDDYVTEQVLGWSHAARVVLGGTSSEHSWVEQAGQEQVTRADGKTLQAPIYELRPVATGTPDFAEVENVNRVLKAMLKASYELELKASGSDVSASFIQSGGTHDPIVTGTAPDAIRRAALLAVQ